MERIKLEEDDSIDRRCGEIYLSTKGIISFHCTLCEEAYFSFELYRAHLDAHFSTNIKLEIGTNDLEKDTLDLTQSLENYLDVELKDFENKLEKMLTTTTLADSIQDKFCVSRRKKNQSTKVPGQISSKPLPETTASELNKNSGKELEIPAEIREVVKRAVYKRETTADADRKHKCPICGFGFKDRGNMIHHFKRHSTQRNYACNECDKKFHSSTELNSHKKYHTQERTLLCTECGRMFFTKSELSSHLKRHRDQRDYHCQHPGCKKAFYSSTLLKNHMLSHSSERRFNCVICDAAFKRSVALKNHIKLHENKREYKCHICEVGFNQKAGLFSHIKTTHK